MEAMTPDPQRAYPRPTGVLEEMKAQAESPNMGNVPLPTTLDQADEIITLLRAGNADKATEVEGWQQIHSVSVAAMRFLAVQIVGYGSEAEADAVIRQAWKDGYNYVKAHGGSVDKIPVPEG
jgi:hypothetical protein